MSIYIRGWGGGGGGGDRCQNIFGNGSKQPRGRSVWQVAPPPQARTQDFILGGAVVRESLTERAGCREGGVPPSPAKRGSFDVSLN